MLTTTLAVKVCARASCRSCLSTLAAERRTFRADTRTASRCRSNDTASACVHTRILPGLTERWPTFCRCSPAGDESRLYSWHAALWGRGGFLRSGKKITIRPQIEHPESSFDRSGPGEPDRTKRTGARASLPMLLCHTGVQRGSGASCVPLQS